MILSSFESIFRSELSNILSSKLAKAVEESMQINLIGSGDLNTTLVSDPIFEGNQISF
jgi:hypothetical protein